MNTHESMDFINDNIVKIIGHYIPLGNNGLRYKGKCPFECKKDKFIVNQDTKNWRCFGCNAKGNAVDFIMKHQKVNFIDAIKIGVEILG